jgi:hypothetical protein
MKGMQGEIRRSEGPSGFRIYQSIPKTPEDRVLGMGPMARVRVQGTGLNRHTHGHAQSGIPTGTHAQRKHTEGKYAWENKYSSGDIHTGGYIQYA